MNVLGFVSYWLNTAHCDSSVKLCSSEELQSLIRYIEWINYSSILVWRPNCGGNDFAKCASRSFISLNFVRNLIGKVDRCTIQNWFSISYENWILKAAINSAKNWECFTVILQRIEDITTYVSTHIICAKLLQIQYTDFSRESIVTLYKAFQTRWYSKLNVL